MSVLIETLPTPCNLTPQKPSFVLDWEFTVLLQNHRTWGQEEPAIETKDDQKLEIIDGSKTMMGLGAGDSYLIPNFLCSVDGSADDAFNQLKPSMGQSEVNYHQMYHMARKTNKKCNVAHKPLSRVKGVQVLREPDSSKIPLYRYSVNNQCQYRIDDFSLTTLKIRNKIEEESKVIQREAGIHLNHAVILCYRDGADCIGFHQDKLLDIKQGSHIYSVSLGAGRPFLLQSPDKSVVQQIFLPHGSLFCLGAKTNESWLHSLPPLSIDPGMRIAVTLRTIDTYVDEVTGEVTGQGGEYQTQNWPFGEHSY